jgi:hypothetical protein
MFKLACMTHLDTSNISYGQKKGHESNCQFDSRPLKVKNCSISLLESDMQHTSGKLSTRATTLLWTSFQLEVCTQSYGAPKSQESQFWEFSNSHLGVPRQNDIWMLVPWPGINYTIRRKGVASPKSELC